MATAEEVLQSMAEVSESAPVCVIDPETRTIIVPPEYQLFGVENDKRTERLYFQCPKIVGDNQDLSRNYQLFINYQNANGEPDAYHIEDMEVDGDNITFSWLLEENVTKYRGNIHFAFGAIIPGNEAEDPDKNRWNTTINTDCTCLVGLKCTQQVAESNPDALVQIWAAIDELKAGGGGSGTGTGGTTNYNNLSNKPKLNGVTLEGNKTLDQVGVLAKNQGSSNSGKFLSVGSDGNVVPADAPSGGTVDPEQIKQAVNGYLEENPVSGMTAEQEQRLNQNTQDVADLKSALTELGNNYKSEYFLLKSPNGQVYKITISNSGEIIPTVFSGGLPDIIPGRLLLWSDEFDSDYINTDIWGFEQGYIRNNEKQYYVSDEKNAYVSDSILHIVALKDNPYSGYEWSSASLDSQLNEKNGFSYGYGLIEIKARCTTPYSGVWPAFWSRGASQPGEGWPMCGEIDIGELYYDGDSAMHHYNPGIFWYDWHSLLQKSQKSTNTGDSSGQVIYQNVDTDWHCYGLERNENVMIFYFDRNEISRINLTELSDSDINSAMKQPMSVKLNLAMGSSGGEIPSNLTKAEYEIDYVRYYAPTGIEISTDSGEWNFPDYMPSELGYSKIARIIPDREMNDGKNQFLYWESSNPVIASVDSGLITTYEQTGNVDISMHDVFGNTKTVNLSVKEGADRKSTEVREIPTNPKIIPWGEKIDILVRLVPNWVTNHDVLASLSPALDGVSVSVKKSTHSIAKYTTECSIIELENNSILLEDTDIILKVTAQDSGVFLDIPITIKKGFDDFDTSGMYAAYLYEYTNEIENGVGQLNTLTKNNKNPITNLYYTATNNNGICRIPGKGIQSQVQGGYFNPISAEGFFLEKFDKNRTLTFVFNIMSGSTEMRGAYNMHHGLLSVCHEGIGHNIVSNTVDGRHGFSFGLVYNDNTENGFIVKNVLSGDTSVNGFVSSKLMSNENEIMPENINTEYLHKDNFIYSVVLVYDSSDKSMASHIVVNGKILATLYNGLKYAISQTNFDKNVFETTDTTISEEILQEDNDKPFYWRYGNGAQVCSDFVRAICVYDKTLSKEEMISIDSILTNRYL